MTCLVLGPHWPIHMKILLVSGPGPIQTFLDLYTKLPEKIKKRIYSESELPRFEPLTALNQLNDNRVP